MILHIFLIFLFPISIYGQYGQEDEEEICLRKFQEAKKCMDKFPVYKEIDKAPFSDRAKSKQFNDELYELQKCWIAARVHEDCPALHKFQDYVSHTKQCSLFLTQTNCITLETLPKLLKTCNGPTPPSDHIESPCKKYKLKCLFNELQKEQCFATQMTYSKHFLKYSQMRCEMVEKNRAEWSHYFDSIDLKIDFPVL
ncbi:unnamed protein product [Caenorhabditis nigoni]